MVSIETPKHVLLEIHKCDTRYSRLERFPVPQLHCPSKYNFTCFSVYDHTHHKTRCILIFLHLSLSPSLSLTHTHTLLPPTLSLPLSLPSFLSNIQSRVVSYYSKMLRRQNMTRAQEERMRNENRRKEYQREDHMRLVAQDKVLRANLASDERVENKRYNR